MKTQLSAEKGTEKEFMLGKNRINFVTMRALGTSSLSIMDLTTGGGGYFYLTSRQLDKLFGK